MKKNKTGILLENMCQIKKRIESKKKKVTVINILVIPAVTYIVLI